MSSLTEIDHLAVLEERGMSITPIADFRLADHLPSVIDAVRPECSFERRSNDFHIVHLHDFPVCFRIHSLSLREHFLETARAHAGYQHGRFCPNILECMRGSTRDEDNRPSRNVHDAVVEFELEL